MYIKIIYINFYFIILLFKMENNIENYDDEIFLRGIITNGENSYYIINQIINYDYMSLCSCVKVKESKDKENKEKYKMTKNSFSAFSFSKKHIQKIVFENEEVPENLYKSLQEKYKKKEFIGENILEIVDYIENEEYIFFITEKIDYIFKDYLFEITEKSFGEGIEIEFRPYICTIYNMINEIHKGQLYAIGLLDLNNFYYKNDPEQIKCLDPILSDLITLLKIYSNSNDYYSYFAPEIYEIFYDKKKIIKFIQDNKSLDLASLYEGISCLSSDIWNFGYLVFEILFGKKPFTILNYKEENKLKENDCYTVPNILEVTEQVLFLITECLQYDYTRRLIIEKKNNNNLIQDFIDKSNDLEEVVIELKKKKSKNSSKIKAEEHAFNFSQTYYEEIELKKKELEKKKKEDENHIEFKEENKDDEEEEIIQLN